MGPRLGRAAAPGRSAAVQGCRRLAVIAAARPVSGAMLTDPRGHSGQHVRIALRDPRYAPSLLRTTPRTSAIAGALVQPGNAPRPLGATGRPSGSEDAHCALEYHRWMVRGTRPLRPDGFRYAGVAVPAGLRAHAPSARTLDSCMLPRAALHGRYVARRYRSSGHRQHGHFPPRSRPTWSPASWCAGRGRRWQLQRGGGCSRWWSVDPRPWPDRHRRRGQLTSTDGSPGADRLSRRGQAHRRGLAQHRQRTGSPAPASH